MRRRDLLAGLGSLAVLGGGAALAFSSDSGEQVGPVTVERLDSDGNPDGEIQVPESGRPTLLTAFATWCSTCRATMPEAVSVHEDGWDAQFVSVSTEPVGATTTREDVADWWNEYGGDWPVGVETDFEVTETFDVRSVPKTVVFDADNTIVYDSQGPKSAEELRDALEQA